MFKQTCLLYSLPSENLYSQQSNAETPTDQIPCQGFYFVSFPTDFMLFNINQTNLVSFFFFHHMHIMSTNSSGRFTYQTTTSLAKSKKNLFSVLFFFNRSNFLSPKAERKYFACLLNYLQAYK